MAEKFTATVIKSTGSWYTVLDPSDGNITMCRIRGLFRLKGSRSTNPVVVGDQVRVERDRATTGDAQTSDDSVIVDILPRRNYIIRRASNLSKESHIIAANIDTAYLVATLFNPVTSTEFIDRFLVTAEAYKIPAVIILNKIDLLQNEPGADAVAEFRHIYDRAGYEVIEISATHDTGIEPLRARMAGHTSLLAGNSGVGKSTIINALDPILQARTGSISDYHHKGRHTTTFSEIYSLGSGGLLIDTPGIKGFGLVDIAPEELARYFPDMMEYARGCSFSNCTHTHEPGCAVIEALARGEISDSRFESYLKMFEGDDSNGKYRK